MASRTILAGDVGGTKVNLALCEVQTNGASATVRMRDQRRYASAQFSGLSEVLRRYFVDTGLPVAQADAVSLGVPGPVNDGKCTTVNLPWVLDAKELSSKLENRPLLLLNDLEAMARGIAALAVGRGLVVLREGKPAAGNRALLAPGTGLGQALMIWTGRGARPLSDEHLVSPSEGGHSDFGPQNEEQIELLRWLWTRHKHVSVEHVLSGPAIHRLFRFFSETGKETVPADLQTALAQPGIDPSPLITARAIKAIDEGEQGICRRALELWMFCLGAEAGNLALKALTLGGLYVGGGVVPNLLGLFSDPVRSRPFFDGLDSKGRMTALMHDVPVYAIEDQCTAIYGAALAGSRI